MALSIAIREEVRAATVPKISPAKRTGKVRLVVQTITVTQHELANATTATLAAQIRDGNKALQIKDSSTDIACPVKLVSSPSVSVFKDTETFTFNRLDTGDEFNRLRTHAPQLVKVVDDIEWCANPGTFGGCALPGHIVLASSPPDPLTLVHEFGHHRGLDGDPDTKRIMRDAHPSGNEVTQAQCNAFKNQ